MADSSLATWSQIVLGVAALVVVGIAVSFYSMSQPPTLSVEGGRVSASSFVYSTEVELSSVTSAEIAEQLPPIVARTNGFALGSTLRGHFRFESGVDAELYVEEDVPPFVVLEHPGGVLAFNTTDPEETRSLFAEIQGAL